MNYLHPLGKETATNIENMMERLGIDQGYRVVPRFGLLFSCALRNCGSCTRRKACADWLTADRDFVYGPPQFCPNFELLWELLCDPGIGHRTQPVR
jgi:Family of unknown function (DUF6455)